MIYGFKKETEPLTTYEKEVLLPTILKGLETKVGKKNAITNMQMINGMKKFGYEKLSEPRIRKIIN